MAGDDTAQFLGLASASIAGAFTTNGSAISVLYDAMTVAWNNGGADPERMPATSFAIVATPAARGRTVTLFIRGFSSPPGAGGVEIEIGGVAMRAASPDETFAAAVTATLSADSDVTPVKATLDLPRPEDGSAASFALDSIDVSLPDCTKGS